MKNKGVARLISASVLVCVLFTLLFIVTVFAADSSSTPLVPDMQGLQITNYEVIIWKDGQKTTPAQITKGMAFELQIRVRDDRVSDPNITAIGKTNSASFVSVWANDSKDEGMTLATGGATGVEYLLRFGVTYTGVGNTFQFDVSYPGLSIPITSRTLVLNNCVEYKEPDSSSISSSEIKTRGTGFVLKSATYGANEVNVGTPFTLEASLLATNGSYAVENTSVTLELPKEITFATGSSVTYIGTVKPGQTVVAAFELFPSAAAVEGSYVITINIKGVNAKDGSEVSASASISVPLVQPERFEMGNAKIPEFLTMGMNDGSGFGTVELLNKGKSTMSNVEAEIVGEGLHAEEGKQYIGNIAGGSSKSVDFNILAESAGIIDGQVIITYENAKGEIKTLTHDFTITVEEMFIPGSGSFGPSFPEPGGSGTGVPLWVWILIVLGVVACGVVVLVVVVKKQKARKAAAEEAELGMDDDEPDTQPSFPNANDASKQSGAQQNTEAPQ